MKNLLIPALLVMNYIFSETLNAQETADDLLDNLLNDKREIVTSVFKSTRILNTHSIKQLAAGDLEFRISHRFGKLNGGVYEIWGLDQATIHFSLEYNPLDFITLGIGRSNFLKTYDGFLKISLLKQQTGKRNIPLFISFISSIEAQTLKNEIEDFLWQHRLVFVNQILIARKVSDRLSLQVTPSFIHKNVTPYPGMKNDILAIGVGGRVKITNRLTFNADTYFLDHGQMPNGITYYQPLSIGFDLETGGHVFQLIFSNSLPMRENGFITKTTGSWREGDIHFGFNISRTFGIHN